MRRFFYYCCILTLALTLLGLNAWAGKDSYIAVTPGGTISYFLNGRLVRKAEWKTAMRANNAMDDDEWMLRYVRNGQTQRAMQLIENAASQEFANNSRVNDSDDSDLEDWDTDTYGLSVDHSQS